MYVEAVPLIGASPTWALGLAEDRDVCATPTADPFEIMSEFCPCGIAKLLPPLTPQERENAPVVLFEIHQRPVTPAGKTYTIFPERVPVN
jgi:hypothetical protein